jgi:putative transposase
MDEIKERMSEMLRGVKTGKDFSALVAGLKKEFYETALRAELDEHLGYEKHDPEGYGSGNSRNGRTSKTLRTEHGPLEIEVPRDREGTFEPQIVRKGQRLEREIADKLLTLYGSGLSTREAARAVEEMYGIEVTAALISRVTAMVLEDVRQWRTRALESCYPIVYFDCIVMKIRDEESSQVRNMAVYLALGVDIDGAKDVLGMWISENEGARFWLGVLTELRNRGLKELLIACVDGLTGFPEAVEAVFPRARVQLCIVHMVRNTLRFVAEKDRKAVAAALRRVYRSATEDEALAELGAFEEAWKTRYPFAAEGWRRNWHNLNTIYEYPEEIRRAIYTTNAIESLNSVIRKTVRKRKIFPDRQSAEKTVWLVIRDASKRWTRPIQNWKAALNHFRITFPQLEEYL